MKLSKITLLVLLASIAATGCNKRPEAAKAEEKTDPNALKTTETKKDATAEAHKGPLSIGVNEKFAALMTAYNKEADKDTLKLTAAYAPASKKLTISKDHSSLRIVSANAEGKAEAADLKAVSKAPVMTLGDKAIDIQVDEAKKQYVLKENSSADADPTKAITVGLKGEDEKLKIAETKYELSPIVLLGTEEAQTQEMVLDLKFYMGEKVDRYKKPFLSSYAGAEGDPTKPECAMISQTGIGAVKPISIGLDLSNQDKVIDLFDQQEALAKIPAGETTFEIVCIRQDASKKPALIAITTTTGFKLKVLRSEEIKEEPKKEEAKK